ncbi:hypothetical protein LIER_26759 [Lithospermum erythrorhizon]|uniref:TPX2 C-terminal domain-containing protein n=1 Tax=Lithospermum erythrorhizon TaxID=34254 RepID=A0AAV3R9I2_LITER
MGKDVTGLSNVNKLNVMPNEETFDRVHVAPKISNDKVEPEQASTGDHNLQAAVDEEVQENQEEVPTVESTNIDPSLFSVRAKIEAFKNTEKKLSFKPSLDASESANTSESSKTCTPKVQPQQVSTQKFDSGISNACDVESGTDSDSPMSKKDDLHTPVMDETIQPHSPSMSGMPLQAYTDERYHDDDEDDCSFTSSSGTSMRSAKFKPTVPVGPKFVCGERVTRRKEFYMKLEEKQKAMEAERVAEEARIKEEEEAALRKLRKSMSYKANPVPSFYRQGQPPKAMLKKLPLTRPKSPNLTRTKSCNESSRSSQVENKSYGRVTRVGSGSTTPKIKDYSDTSSRCTTPKNKDRSDTKNDKSLNKFKDTNGTTKVRNRGQAKDTAITRISEEEQMNTDTPVVEETESPNHAIADGETKNATCIVEDNHKSLRSCNS